MPESSKLISLPVLRSGELDSDIYVDCSTTTSLGNHRHRNVLVKLAAGESHGFCDLEMGDDDDLLPPSVATLRVRLANPSSSDVEIAAGFSEATVRFVSDERERESIVVVSMARGQVHTEEPSSSDACILVLIGIVRSGDVTSPLTTSVRVSVVADTALGNRVDFDDSAAAVQASQVQFEAGARLAHVRVPIMYDEVREESSSGGGGERFAVTLSLPNAAAANGASEPTVRLGNLTTTFVYIRDMSPVATTSTTPRHLSPSLMQHMAALRHLFANNKPLIVPLDALNVSTHDNVIGHANRSVVGHPLACLHVNNSTFLNKFRFTFLCKISNLT